jgi:hypothetical protein
MHKLIATVVTGVSLASCSGPPVNARADSVAAIPPATALTAEDSARAIVDALTYHRAIFSPPVYAALCGVSDVVFAMADSLSRTKYRTGYIIQRECRHNENPNSKADGESMALEEVVVRGDSIHVQFTVVRRGESFLERVSMPMSRNGKWSDGVLTIHSLGFF